MKKKSNKLWIVTVLALGICVALVAGGYQYLKKRYPNVTNGLSNATKSITSSTYNKIDVEEKELTDANLIKLEGMVENSSKESTPLYSANKAINLVLNKDASISKASNQLKVPKSFLQAILLREISNINDLDSIADKAVEMYFDEVEKKGSSQKKADSSTGLGQIFAATAIESHNELVSKGIINDNRIDANDIATRKSIWYKLKDDDEYNILAVAKALKAKASYKGFASKLYQLDDSQKQSLFKAYNGSGTDAQKYGEVVLSYQKELSIYNDNHK